MAFGSAAQAATIASGTWNGVADGWTANGVEASVTVTNDKCPSTGCIRLGWKSAQDFNNTTVRRTFDFSNYNNITFSYNCFNQGDNRTPLRVYLNGSDQGTKNSGDTLIANGQANTEIAVAAGGAQNGGKRAFCNDWSIEGDFVGPVDAAGTSAISGTAQVGEVLTASVTDSNGVSGTITYNWIINGISVQNSSSNTYTPQASDVGFSATVTGSYTDDDGFTTGANVSAPTQSIIAPINVAGQISISGTPQVNATLSAADLTDANGVGSITDYEWFNNNEAGTGTAGVVSTDPSYQLVAEDEGDAITLTVTYTQIDGNSPDTASDTTNFIEPKPPGPDTGDASIAIDDNTPGVGDLLTASITLDDPEGIPGAVTYTWLTNGNANGNSGAI
ncbi:MAG: hypothetical protein GY918_12670 [Gammaproteobacteria bacterium]|nr:hypothetical protein [Gammaproteobacteria bacterium]